MTTAISIENVSKCYHLGVIGHGTLREDLQSAWARMRGKPDPNAVIGAHEAIEGDTLWALQDVSLDIGEGEVWGIIGRNGAGKSTLLKLLSRVTAPTAGRIRVRGRVASLLEVGTGFHPELTGRENIFLNGAILGMTKAEVKRKFDEIVEFSEIGKFIDTPVKRYSSGMYVRLAFAVAAHLDPEILVVDEVLAVGDAAFQKKCLGKMGDVAHEGRTVLFVSHNMPSVLSLCEKAVWLKQGRVFQVGTSAEVVAGYQSSVFSGENALGAGGRVSRSGSGLVRLMDVRCWRDAERREAGLMTGAPLTMAFGYETDAAPIGVFLEVMWLNARGEKCMHFNSGRLNQLIQLEKGRGAMVCRMEKCPLMPGDYLLEIKLYDVSGTVLDHVRDAAVVAVSSGDFYGTGRLPSPDMCSVLVEHGFDATSMTEE